MTERAIDQKARRRIKRFIAGKHTHRVRREADTFIYVEKHYEKHRTYKQTKSGQLRVCKGDIKND